MFTSKSRPSRSCRRRTATGYWVSFLAPNIPASSSPSLHPPKFLLPRPPPLGRPILLPPTPTRSIEWALDLPDFRSIPPHSQTRLRLFLILVPPTEASAACFPFEVFVELFLWSPPTSPTQPFTGWLRGREMHSPFYHV